MCQSRLGKENGHKEREGDQIRHGEVTREEGAPASIMLAKLTLILLQYSGDVRSARKDIERLEREGDGLDKAPRMVQ